MEEEKTMSFGRDWMDRITNQSMPIASRYWNMNEYVLQTLTLWITWLKATNTYSNFYSLQLWEDALALFLNTELQYFTKAEIKK